VYQLIADANSPGAGWELAIIDTETGRWAKQIAIAGNQGPDSKGIEGLFRTFDGGRIKVAAGAVKRELAGDLSVTHIAVREVAGLDVKN
jgi:hypothetical protein